MLLGSMSPLLLIYALFCSLMVASVGIRLHTLSATSERAQKKAYKYWRGGRAPCIDYVFTVFFFVYPSCSAISFSAFDCEHFEDGTRYLRVDYQIDCDGPTHKAFMVYAVLMLAVYPFGVPVLYAFALYSHTPVFTAVKNVQAEIRDRRQRMQALKMIEEDAAADAAKSKGDEAEDMQALDALGINMVANRQGRVCNPSTTCSASDGRRRSGRRARTTATATRARTSQRRRTRRLRRSRRACTRSCRALWTLATPRARATRPPKTGRWPAQWVARRASRL